MALISPWVFSVIDYAGAPISITVNFVNITGLLLSAQVDRDVTCQYNKIFFGVGGDGSPNSASVQFTCTDNLLSILVAQLNVLGMLTISDMLSMQVTAGP